MSEKIDILCVGDVVTDAFIRLLPHRASVESDSRDHHPLLCMTFGTKIPFESATVVSGVGNSPNAAVSFARLGLNSSLYSNIGDDKIGEEILVSLRMNKVSTEFVKIHRNMASNYHYVLWYGTDRTILIKHEEYKYVWPRIDKSKLPKWLYLSSVAENAEHIHSDMVRFLDQNPSVKLAFQPGTFQFKMGVQKLHDIYKRADFFAVNLEEAQQLTGIISRDIIQLMRGVLKYGPEIVAITDGPNGSYVSDGRKVWSMPNYPDPQPPFERTGCGDAFTSTFVAALAYGHDIETAMKWAPINPMSVVQKVGAQEGLLNKNQLLNLLNKAPKNYFPRELAKL